MTQIVNVWRNTCDVKETEGKLLKTSRWIHVEADRLNNVRCDKYH